MIDTQASNQASEKASPPPPPPNPNGFAQFYNYITELLTKFHTPNCGSRMNSSNPYHPPQLYVLLSVPSSVRGRAKQENRQLVDYQYAMQLPSSNYVVPRGLHVTVLVRS